MLQAINKYLGTVRKFWKQLVLVLILLIGYLLYHWYFYDFAYTRDAYVYADVINIASNVNGPIKAVYIKDNQRVAKGQKLLLVDPSPFQYQAMAAKAELLKAKTHYTNASSLVVSAQDQLKQSQSAYQKIQSHFNRVKTLFSRQVISKDAYEKAKSAMQIAKFKVDAQKQTLQTFQNNVSRYEVLQAKANDEQENYNLTNTVLKAPKAGFISNFTLNKGDYIQSGKGLFALVENTHWWVIARFRETIVRLLKRGQPVSISLDMYPGVEFKGYVDSIGWGINRSQASSEAAASTLTYLTPTEDWVRITQRFPVRIVILPKKGYLFRSGASARIHVSV